MNFILLYLTCAVVVGSLPVGAVFAWLKGKSLFQPGQRQTIGIGETFEILGTPVGLVVTLLDFIKGLVVVWPLPQLIMGQIPTDWWLISLGGLLAVVSHSNSFWLGFRGGRGLATTFGVLVGILTIPALIAILIWGCLAFWGLSTKPGALSAAAAMPFLSILWILMVQPERLNYLFLVAFLSLWAIWEQRFSLQNYLGLPKRDLTSQPDVGNDSLRD